MNQSTDPCISVAKIQETVRFPLVIFTLLGGVADQAMGQVDQHADSDAVYVEEVEDVFAFPESGLFIEAQGDNLFIKGEGRKIALSESHIHDLGEFLKDYPNWSVYVAQKTSDEIYVSEVTGKKHRGLDAIKKALGNQFLSMEGIGTSVDPRNGMENGCILSISFDPRDLRFFSSEAFDHHDVGYADRFWKKRCYPRMQQLMRNNDTYGAITYMIRETQNEYEKKVQAQQEHQQRLKKLCEERIADATRQFPDIQERYDEFIAFEEVDSQMHIINIQAGISKSQRLLTKGSYDESNETIHNVLADLADLEEALNDFPLFSEKLDTLEHRVAQIDQQKCAPDAQDARSWAVGSIQKARETLLASHLMGIGPAYQTAEMKTEAYARRVRQLEQNKTATKVFGWGSLGVLASILLGVGFSKSRSRRPKKLEFMKAFTNWEKRLRTENDDILQAYAKRRAILGKDYHDFAARYAGKSQEFAEAAVMGVSRQFLLHSAAAKILSQIKKDLTPTPRSKFHNLFHSDNYDAGIYALQKKATSFKNSPNYTCLDGFVETDDEMEREELLLERIGKPHTQKSRHTFEEFFELFEKEQLQTNQALDRLESAQSGIDKMYKQIEDIFRELTQIDKAILDESRPLGIDISEVVTQIKGDCTNFLQKIHQQRTTDPIGACTSMSSLYTNLTTIGSCISRIHTSLGSEIALHVSTLRDQEIQTSWCQTEAKEQIVAPLTLLAASQDEDEADFTQKAMRINNAIESLEHRIRKTFELFQTSSEFYDSSKNLSARIDEARSQMGKAHDLQEEKIMTEPHANVDELIDELSSSLASIHRSLSSGNTQGASEEIERVRALEARIQSIITTTLEVFEQFEKRFSAASDRYEKLQKDKSTYSDKLNLITGMFDSSALRLREDDYDGKGGDDHVANNITESDEAFSDIRVGLEHAKRAIGGGQALLARSLMMEVRNDLDFVEERYQEIDQKNISLDQCIEKNKQDFLALSTLISEIDRRFDESIIQSPLTVKLLDGAKETREQCQEELKEQRNPYEVSAYIQKLSEEVHVVQKSYERDEESRASYIQTISRLEDHMKQLTSKKVTVTGDKIPDSRAMRRLLSRVSEFLESASEDAEKKLEAHQDWQAACDGATQLVEHADLLITQIGNELKNGQRAQTALKTARASVREARSWRPPRTFRDVKIRSKYGQKKIEQADQFFSEGKYDDTIAAAREARREAESAIDTAQEEIRTIQRERRREAREEEQRRARRRRRSSYTSRSSSWLSDSSWSSSNDDDDFFSSSSTFSVDHDSGSSGGGW